MARTATALLLMMALALASTASARVLLQGGLAGNGNGNGNLNIGKRNGEVPHFSCLLLGSYPILSICACVAAPRAVWRAGR